MYTRVSCIYASVCGLPSVNLLTPSFSFLSVDPEMRAEFEKQSRSGPLSGASRSAALAAGAGPGGAAGGFDLAGWMAGANSSPAAATDASTDSRGVATGRDGGSGTHSGRRRG